MSSAATLDNYASIIGGREKADDETEAESEIEYRAEFEDVSQIQDGLFDWSSGSENEVTRTDQLRLRPRQKRAHRKFDDFSILLRRKYLQKRDVLHERGRRLEIQSARLQENMRQIVKPNDDDEIDWHEDPIKIPEPFYALFFHRIAIEAFEAGDSSNTDKEEMRLVHDFIHREEGLKTVLKQYEQSVSSGKISFDVLWTMYPPDTLVVNEEEDVLECYRCINRLEQHTDPRTQELYYILNVEHLGFEGAQLGTIIKRFVIKNFKGVRNIYALPISPLEGHPRQQEIREQLHRRHAWFLSFMEEGHLHKHGQGPAWIKEREYPHDLKRGFQVNGRVVLDQDRYYHHHPGDAHWFLTRYGPANEINEPDSKFAPMPESAKLLCPARMPGFSLADRRWGWFLVDEPWLTDIEWKEDSFRHLVLEPDKKQLVQTLVRGHLKGNGVGFEDLVAGKGKGLTFLLRGPPGLGKTLMAECLSEHVRKPLYRAAAGEMTMDVSTLEARMQVMFDLGTRWGALILLDEADVLMSERKTGQLELNAVVSSFLRVLEYYEGILFLTTNKPDEFDEAIRNRIQLEVTFAPIDQAGRRTIWQNILNRIPGKDEQEGLWSDELFDALSEIEVNGREVKNLLRLATCHASGEDVPLHPAHLVNVIRVKSDTRELGALDKWSSQTGPTG